MKKEIIENFGGNLRVRVCGILIEDNQVLMVKHRGLSEAGYLWAPPGGGLNFGQKTADCLINEFQEETGLDIEVLDLLFVNEYHNHPLHAIELFFEVQRTGGRITKGYDPELATNEQIIEEVRFFSEKDIQKHRGPQIHSIFHHVTRLEQLLNLKGYFQNWK